MYAVDFDRDLTSDRVGTRMGDVRVHVLLRVLAGRADGRSISLRDRGVQVIAHVSAIVLTPLSPRHAPVDTVVRLPQGFANTLARKVGQVISGIPHVWLGKTMDVEV
jgi:hypothetical protein